MKKLIAICAVVFFVLTVSAGAVSYSVGGWTNQYPAPTNPPLDAPHVVDGWGYPGDTVTLAGDSGSFDLVDGASYTLKINTLLWGVDYTYNGTETAWDYPANWPDLTFAIDATRSITIGTATGNISQAGTLLTTYFDDSLSFAAGTMVSLYVADSGQFYRVDVTALSLPVANVTNFNGYIDPPAGGFAQAPRDVMATFVVTQVPEPATMLLFGLGAVLLRKKK
jgi:hypothetical protein